MNDLVEKAVGPYLIVDKLGEGGMATVYKAYQPCLERYVALKLIRPELVDRTGFVPRFRREAKLLARLSHPNVVHIYDFGEEGQDCYLVMEYVAGSTLKDWLTQEGVLPLDRVLPVLRQVSAALDHAHDQGIIHRDIKPTNIMLTPDGRALLADFGISKLVGGSDDLTQTGSTTGTPAYMSPEQINPEMGAIGPTSDVYSLGVVTYQMLTGQLPFIADTTIAVMVKRLREPPTPPRVHNADMPEAVERVILKALRLDPAQRYPSAGEMIDALSQAAVVSGGTRPGDGDAPGWLPPPPEKPTPAPSDFFHDLLQYFGRARKRCPHCRHRNPVAATFCGECGTPLPERLVSRPCTECGFTDNLPDALFCIKCGASRKRRWRTPLFMLLGGVVLVLAAALVLWQTGLFDRPIKTPTPIAASRSVPQETDPSGGEKASKGADPPTRVVSQVTVLPTVLPTTLTATSTPSATPWPSPTPMPSLTSTPSPTKTPTRTPSRTPTPSRTLTRTRTRTPTPSRTPSPTHTPTRSFASCTTAVYDPFRNIWQADFNWLGCASSVWESEMWMGQEGFERGEMLWRQDDDKIYVMYSTGRWESYSDFWREGDPDYSCGVPESPPTPMRGFGKIWCTYSVVSEGLGNATTVEQGGHGVVQQFNGGWILQTGDGQVYVLFNNGAWKR